MAALRQAGRGGEAQALALESAQLFGAGAMWQDAAAEFSALPLPEATAYSAGLKREISRNAATVTCPGMQSGAAEIPSR